MTRKVTAPGRWVPTAYLAEGIPYALVTLSFGTMFKDLGYSDSDITVALASISSMWSLKPLYAGFLEMYGTKKRWTVTMSLAIAVLLILSAIALTLEAPYWPLIGLAWVIAGASATQDVCIDGLYVTTLDPPSQAKWIGFQGAFWTTGRIFATALVVGVAGFLQMKEGLTASSAWAVALTVAASGMLMLSLYHAVTLPQGSVSHRPHSAREVVNTFFLQWQDFLTKQHISSMLLFVFLYRSGEGFLMMETQLFMQAGLDSGGLGMCATEALSTNCPHALSDKATIDGLVSTAVSLLFGVLGGAYASKKGLSTRTLLIMATCMNVPNLTLVYLSQAASSGEPLSMGLIATMITLEKAGYSFGMVANMLYMMQQISPGRFHMTHFAFCTALMNLVIIPTTAASGPLAEMLGYSSFFLFVCAATVPSFVAAYLAPFPKAATKC